MTEDELLVIAKLRDEMSGGLAKIQAQIEGLGNKTKRTASHTDAFDKALNRVRGRLGGVGSALRLNVFGVGALGAAFVALGAKSLSAFDEAQAAVANTNAVLRSTAGIAGVSAKHVDELSQSLSYMIGVDDEATRGVENMLLTFTNIRNVGADKIFDAASQAVLDMDIAMTQGHSTMESLKATAILVGKALQDPVKGFSSLHRVGVALTPQQQQQIKDLVKMNDLIGAQTVLLGELNTEFGGQASAFGQTGAASIGRAKKLWGDLLEDMGAKLLPIVQKEMPAFEASISNLVPKLGDLAEALATDVIPGLIDAVGFVANIIDGLRESLGLIGLAKKKKGESTSEHVAKGVFSTVLGGLGAFGGALIGHPAAGYAVGAGIGAKVFDPIVGGVKNKPLTVPPAPTQNGPGSGGMWGSAKDTNVTVNVNKANATPDEIAAAAKRGVALAFNEARERGYAVGTKR